MLGCSSVVVGGGGKGVEYHFGSVRGGYLSLTSQVFVICMDFFRLKNHGNLSFEIPLWITGNILFSNRFLCCSQSEICR